MSPTRALPIVALTVALALAAAAPAPRRPRRQLADDAPDPLEKTNSTITGETNYRPGPRTGKRPGQGADAARFFSQLLSPLVQFVVSQLLAATNLVGALAGAGRAGPNAVLQLFSASLGAASGGAPPPRAQAAAALW